MRSSCARRHGSRDAGGVLRRDAVAGFLVVHVVGALRAASRVGAHSTASAHSRRGFFVTDSWEERTAGRIGACNEQACNRVSRQCLVIWGRSVSPCDELGSLSGKLSSRSRSSLSARSHFGQNSQRRADSQLFANIISRSGGGRVLRSYAVISHQSGRDYRFRSVFRIKA